MQDLPPPGGFGPIHYKRHLPKKGPPGWALLLGCAGVIGLGSILHYRGSRIYKELDREKRQARLALLPTIMAESDLAFLRVMEENQKIETEIMKNVPGWKSEWPANVYLSGKYCPPSYFLSDFLTSE